jgi:hypothetical protein
MPEVALGPLCGRLSQGSAANSMENGAPRKRSSLHFPSLRGPVGGEDGGDNRPILPGCAANSASLSRSVTEHFSRISSEVRELFVSNDMVCEVRVVRFDPSGCCFASGEIDLRLAIRTGSRDVVRMDN